MNIISRIKKIRNNRKLGILETGGFIELGKESIYCDSFRVEIRHPEKGHKYLKIGNGSIIDGHYIFEKESGEIIIGDRVHIGGCTFISISSINIGNDVTIAWDCMFYDHNSHSVNWSERKNDTIQEFKDLKTYGDLIKNKNWDVVKTAPITIEDKVWIGVGCKILKGVTIGEGAVIAAGSVVTRDVTPWTVWGGNPATFLKSCKE